MLELKNPEQNPLNYENISKQQQLGQILLGQLESKPDDYFYKNLDDENSICYSKSGEDQGTQWKIALPHSMVKIKWFHDVFSHPGSNE